MRKPVIDERSRVLQQNEKTKVWSNQAANLGSGLIAAAFGRAWLLGLDPWAIIWGVLGFFCGIDRDSAAERPRSGELKWTS
jgi:hypothetical protein